MQNLYEENLNAIRKAALDAGRYILTRSKTALKAGDISVKEDGTPVTEIDRAAEDIIYKTLSSLSPNYPIIAEERFAAGECERLNGATYFWLVDALDGTKDFIAGTGQYTVNIALIHRGQPICGLIYAPEKKLFCEAISGKGAYLYHIEGETLTRHEKPLHVRDLKENLTLITSGRQKTSSKLKELFDGYQVDRRKTSGSSIKFVMIASGEADIYPRLGYTSEWDIAAGDAILREAGGLVIDLSTGQPFTYGHEARNFLNPEFIALPNALYKLKPHYFYKPF